MTFLFGQQVAFLQQVVILFVLGLVYEYPSPIRIYQFSVVSNFEFSGLLAYSERVAFTTEEVSLALAEPSWVYRVCLS